VILIDTNMLVYAMVATLPEHAAAKVWLESKLGGAAPVGMPWASLIGFVRVVCNPRIFTSAKDLPTAWGQVESWLDQPVVRVPQPTDRHRSVLATLVPSAKARPGLIHDAHLAALAIEHGLTLCSADRDFARFPGLRWENPLDAGTARP